MCDNFNKCIDLVLSHEGGFVDDASDNGGATKYGISLNFYKSLNANATKQDIIDLTRDKAVSIYYNGFWKHYGCDRLPLPVAYMLFDMVVNMGKGAKVFQRAVGVKDDGIIGSNTISVAGRRDVKTLIGEITKERVQEYCLICRKNSSQWKFFDGWVNRSIDVNNKALEFAR